jgi:hypothetical protein
MRWALLYARSRQVPIALAALVLAAAGIRFLAGDSWSLPYAALALVAGVAVAATGLSGQDADLDRSAAIQWFPRRATHLLLIGVVAAAAVQTLGTANVHMSLVVRDVAGFTGLAGIAATVGGGQFGWTLPFGWCAIAFFVPQDSSLTTRMVTWMLQPAGTPTATWTAVLLAVAGIVAYAARGGRR